jgi:Zn-dependent peptidase ImmA (M78 family)
MKNEMDINAEALEFRKKLGLDGFTPIDIFSLVTTAEEITLINFPMNKNISGLCNKDSKNKVIGVNSLLSYGRQRFTIAHELYHLYFQDTIKSLICPTSFDNGKDEIEIEANKFATYFLMPYETLYSFVKKEIKKDKINDKLSLEDILKIEQYFGMSRKAILWRLEEQGFKFSIRKKDLEKNVIKSAIKYGYGTELYKNTIEEKQYFTLGGYIKKVELLKEKNKISESKYEELLMDAFRSDIVYGFDDRDLYD